MRRFPAASLVSILLASLLLPGAAAAQTVVSASNVPIPDNSPIGVSSTLAFPDAGASSHVSVSVDIVNSDISG